MSIILYSLLGIALLIYLYIISRKQIAHILCSITSKDNDKNNPTPIKNDYTISYGSTDSPHILTVFFDCESIDCVIFYRYVFPLIRKRWIITKQLHVIFIPYPLYQNTLTFIACCEELTSLQKRILFETIMETDQAPLKLVENCIISLGYPLVSPTETVTKEGLGLTTTYQFETLPALLFDDQQLSAKEQETLIDFLEQKMQILQINHNGNKILF